MIEPDWISAAQAQTRLGVRAQTLYAYVSRGYIGVRADPADARRSQYRATDVEALAARHGRSRKLADVASGAIAWGEPVLTSAITSVRDGRLYYRGRDAARLSEDQSLEAVARLLRDAPGPPARDTERPAPSGDGLQRLFAAVAARAATAPPLLGSSVEAMAAESDLLLDIVADAVAGQKAPGPIHERLALAWGADPAGADLIRRMLVLLADHELNASTFAARVTASTGASLAAAVLAGLAALSGPRHGGHGAVVQGLAAEARAYGAGETVRNRLIGGRDLPGFGHPLYPEGDIRAKILLDAFDLPGLFAELHDVAKGATGLEPNIDFAMVAACAACGLPDGAPFALFATARSAGWIAHAVEQVQTRQLIRPRARYAGLPPEAGD